MFNSIKNEIEKEFNKEKNYNIILSKVEGVSIMKQSKVKYVLAPICVIIAIILFNYFVLFNQEDNKKIATTNTIKSDSINNEIINNNDITTNTISNNTTRWAIKEVYRESNVQESIATVPRWEEMSISQQFFEAEYDDKEYSSRITTISNDNIGENIGLASFIGYDAYTRTYHNKEGEVYNINGLSSDCVIAVKFEEDDNYYVYVNSYYRPETLGEFIDSLNLKEIVSFGTVHYNYFSTDENGNKQYENVEFSDVNDETIWQMLFNDLSVQNVHNDNDIHNRVMGISVDIPLLGYENISVSVSDDGYLTTNILDTGKTFYIGEDKVEQFVNYVIENCEGYRIVYIDKNIDEETEETGEDRILMVENKVEEYVVTEVKTGQ